MSAIDREDDDAGLELGDDDTLDLGEDAPKEQVKEEASADPVEALARELGWRDDYQGAGAVSAKDYILRQQAFLKDTSSELRKLKQAQQKTAENIVRIQRETLDRARKELREQLDEAVRVGDHTAARRATEELEKRAAQQVEHAADDGIPDDARQTLESWVDENAWFRNDEDARAYAQAQYARQVSALGRDDPSAILPKVTEAVRKRFPEHWSGQQEQQQERRPQPRAVNGTPSAASAPRGTPGAKGWNDMPREARLVATEFIDDGSFRPDLKTLSERRSAYAKLYHDQESR